MLPAGRRAATPNGVSGAGCATTGAQRRARDADAVTNGCRLAAGKHRDLAVGLDAHLHLGADQAQTLGAHRPVISPEPEKLTSALGALATIVAMGVAHDDVADAQRGASVGVALELRAADLDAMMAAEIFLDRGGEPRRREIEIDRPAAEPPPQRQHPDQHQCRHRWRQAIDTRRQRSPEAQRRQPPGGETELRGCQVRRAANARRARDDACALQQVELDAGLQLAQGRDIRTWCADPPPCPDWASPRPPPFRCTPGSGRRIVAADRRFV